MDAELWRTLDDLFREALKLPLGGYEDFIRARTHDNKELETELRALLNGHGKDSVLDTGLGTFFCQIESQLESEPPKQIGPYSIIRELGTGGMGVVYLGFHEQWKFTAAIKVPQGIWISPHHRSVFEAEQQSLARLIHPNIARILEGKTLEDGTPWFAMEYVEGKRITIYCEHHSLPVSERLRLFLEICDATRYAHSKEVIHRDLKPSNILVTAEGEVKLLDFGIAKQMSEGADLPASARTGLNPITRAYAAPEQIAKGEISSETDVYALGIVLYELLAGQLPFTPVVTKGEKSFSESAATKPSAVPSRLPGLTRGHWADLDAMILKAIHKDAASRYRTVDALIQDAQRFIAEEPLKAHPYSALYRTGKFIRRNRKSLSFVATMLGIIIALIVISMLELDRARNAAVEEAARARRATQFTQEMLSGGDVENGPPKDMKLSDMLGLGLHKAESLGEDPIQQAEILTTIGSLYAHLGEYGKADALLHRAYGILAVRTPVSHDLSQVLMDLGVLYDAQSASGRSTSCMRRALAIEERIVPPDTQIIFHCKTAIASSFLDADPKTAVMMLADLLKGPPPAVTEEMLSDVWNNLATGYLNMRDYAKAEPFVRKTLTYIERTRPAINPDISTALINLSMIQRQRKEYRDAELNLRKALAIDIAFYKPGHEETGDVKRLLGNTLYMEGRYDDAFPLARQALAEERGGLGPTHPRTLHAMHLVGLLDLKQGNLPEARKLFEAEIAARQSRHDVENLPAAFSSLGDVYIAQRLYKEAEQPYRKAMDLYATVSVPIPDYAAQTSRKLGEALMSEGKYASAEAPLLASYKVWNMKPKFYDDELRLTGQDLLTIYRVLKHNPELEKPQQELRGAP